MKDIPQFKPAWWLNNPHLQTMWPEILRKRIELPLKYEKFELMCGDFLDLAWSQTDKKETVILLHGLGGSIDSPYMNGMLHALNRSNFNTLALHFRGCGKEPNRHIQMFHGGQTCDLAEVVKNLKNRNPDNKLFLVGFSIGANVLLKYLGESKENSLVSGAVAISVPFLLKNTQENLSRGFARIYQQYLLTRLKILVIRKFIDRKDDNIDLWSLLTTKDIKQFDELLTVPLHGFKDVYAYYSQSSSFYYLRDIRTPTLIIHAKDDPFFPERALPTENDLSKSTNLLITENGGHVGFVSGTSPNNPIYWLEQIVPAYLFGLTAI